MHVKYNNCVWVIYSDMQLWQTLAETTAAGYIHGHHYSSQSAVSLHSCNGFLLQIIQMYDRLAMALESSLPSSATLLTYDLSTFPIVCHKPKILIMI